MAILWTGPKEHMEALIPDTFEWLREVGLGHLVARVVKQDGHWAVEVPGIEKGKSE
jgi:hypothetical protein